MTPTLLDPTTLPADTWTGIPLTAADTRRPDPAGSALSRAFGGTWRARSGVARRWTGDTYDEVQFDAGTWLAIERADRGERAGIETLYVRPALTGGLPVEVLTAAPEVAQ